MNRQHGTETLRSNMNLHFRTLAVVFAGALSSGCVVVPITIEDYDPDCRIVTRHMELKSVQLAAFDVCRGQGCDAAVLAALGVTAVTMIVSGSIVVVGNVAYWAERRLSCGAPNVAAASPRP